VLNVADKKIWFIEFYENELNMKWPLKNAMIPEPASG